MKARGDAYTPERAFLSIVDSLRSGGSFNATSSYETINNVNRSISAVLARVFNDLDVFLDYIESLDESSLDPHDLWKAIRFIAHQMLRSDILAARRFLKTARADERAGITMDNLALLDKGFVEYVDLLTGARQLIDRLVTNAYLYGIVKASEFNYALLSSLSSFKDFATHALAQAVYINAELSALLETYRSMSHNRRKSWSITSTGAQTFGMKVTWLNERLCEGKRADLVDHCTKLHRFASDYTHVGFIAAMVSSRRCSLIPGDDIGPFLLSAENYSELLTEVLDTVSGVATQFYLPAVHNCFAVSHAPNRPEIHTKLSRILADAGVTLELQYRSYHLASPPGVAVPDTFVVECPCGAGEMRVGERQPFCHQCGSMPCFTPTDDGEFDPHIFSHIRLPDGSRVKARLTAHATVRVRPTLVPPEIA